MTFIYWTIDWSTPNLDAATADLPRPSVARICVELDLLKKLPRRIWLECGNSIHGFRQEIVYEELPNYCKHCKHLGHEISICKHANPYLSKASVTKDKGTDPDPINKQKEVP